MSDQLRQVNLTKNTDDSSPIHIKSSQEVRDYNESKQEILAYLNNVANLLQRHNEQIAPIVQSYNARKNNPNQ